MRTIHPVLGLVAGLLLVTAGCGKSDKTPPPSVVNGVTVDLPKLNAAFVNADPELARTATQVGFNMRYAKYEDALMALDKLTNDPKVNEAQKKVVNEVIEQVKKLAMSSPPPAQ